MERSNIEPISKQIDDYAAKIQKQKEARKGEEAKAKASVSFSNRFLRLFIENKIMFYKDELTLADLSDLPADLQMGSIKSKIMDIKQKLIKNRAKHSQLFKGVNNFFGLYDTVIKELISTDLIYLRLWEVAIGIAINGFLISLWQLLQTLRNFNDYGEYATVLGLCFAFYFIIKVAEIFARKKEAFIKMKVKLGLSYHIFRKLVVCDQYFLDNADNNMIYKLMYLEFEEYTRYSQNYMSSIPSLLAMLALILQFLYIRTPNMPYVTFFIGLHCFLKVFFEGITRRYYLQYKYVTFEQRKCIYEFIHNFKSFNLKNLKNRFRMISVRLNEQKKRYLNKIHLANKFEYQTLYLLSISVLLTGTIIHYEHEKEGKQHITEFSPVSSYLVYHLYTTAIEVILNKTALQASQYFYYTSSKEIFDKFFNNDFIIQSKGFDSEGVQKGEVIIKNCQILERDNKNINDTLNYILQKSTEKGMKLQKNLYTASLDSQPLIKQDLGDDLAVVDSLVSRLMIICNNLTAHITNGSKVCLYDNGNTSGMKGFLGVLRKENFISKGSVKVGGSVSYFNGEDMQFMVGKTIRENILYGEESKRLRYEEILKYLGTQFSNYPGQDLYQVAEGALNIKNEDRRLILLARFLYQDADIYIMDEYLNKVDLTFLVDQIKTMFKTFLENKTVIFVAKELELIKLSDKILCFKDDTEHHTIKTDQFLQYLEKEQFRKHSFKTMNENAAEGRVDVLNCKVKNTLFVANISFDEELRIYKQLEKQEAEIQKIKQNRNNIVEILTYGVYLTQRKRDIGTAIVDDERSSNISYWCMISDLLGNSWVKLKLSLIFTVHFISLVLLLITEYLIFYYDNEFLQVQKKRFNSSIVPTALSTSIIFVFFNMISALVSMFIFKRFFQSINSELLDSIINCDISLMQNRRSHRVLETLCKDLYELEVRLPNCFRKLIYKFYAVISSLVLLTFLTSFWVLLIVLITLLLKYLLQFRLVSYYVKADRLNGILSSKMNDFIFQLLSLIGGYRVKGLTEKLTQKFTNITNNHSKTRMLRDLEIRDKIIKLGGFIDLFGCAAMIANFWWFLYQNSFNLLNINRGLLVWALLLIFRYTWAQLDIPEILFNLYELWQHYCKIKCFTQNRLNKTAFEKLAFSRKKVDFFSPIVFTNVSVTLGIQPILKKLTFTIRPRARVAIVGVDGGGRSLIFELLTNTIPRDKIEDSEIKLFGLNLEYHSETTIKENIFVMERNPVLFMGTLRENLDPFNRSDTQVLANLLNEVGFSTVIQKEYQNMPEHNHQLKRFVERKKNMLKRMNSRAAEGKMGLEHEFVPEEEYIEEQSKLNEQASPTNSNILKRWITSIAGSPKRNYRIPSMSSLVQKSGPVDPKEADVHFAVNHAKSKETPEMLKSVPGKKGKSRIITKIKTSMPTIQNPSNFSNIPTPKKIIEPEKTSIQIHEKASVQVQDRSKQEISSIIGLRDIPESNMIYSNNDQDFVEVKSLSQGSVKTIKKDNKSKEGFIIELKKQSSLEEPGQNSKRVSKNNLSRRNLQIDITDNIDQGSNVNMLNSHKNFEIVEYHDISRESKPQSPEEAENDLEKFIADASRQERGSFYMPTRAGNKTIGGSKENFKDTGELNNPDSSLVNGLSTPVSQKDIENFLNIQVQLKGKNISTECKRLIMFCRVLCSQPKILLTYEDSLDFGYGVTWNLKKINEKLPDSTILVITKQNRNLLNFDKILFIDGGKVLEQGNPKRLLKDHNSFIYRYVKQTDVASFERLDRQLKSIEYTRSIRKSKHASMLNSPSIPGTPIQKHIMKNLWTPDNSKKYLLESTTPPEVNQRRNISNFEKTGKEKKIESFFKEIEQERNVEMNKVGSKKKIEMTISISKSSEVKLPAKDILVEPFIHNSNTDDLDSSLPTVLDEGQCNVDLPFKVTQYIPVFSVNSSPFYAQQINLKVPKAVSRRSSPVPPPRRTSLKGLPEHLKRNTLMEYELNTILEKSHDSDGYSLNSPLRSPRKHL